MMLDVTGLAQFGAAQVQAAGLLRACLRAVRLSPPAPASVVHGFAECAARPFHAPVQFVSQSRLGTFWLTLERDAVETALDRIMPDWRAEDPAALPFEWCLTCLHDLFAAGTPLADAGLSLRIGGAVVTPGDAPGPTMFGTVVFEGGRRLVAVTLVEADIAAIRPPPTRTAHLAHPSLPMRAVVALPGPALGLADLRGLARGDVVILGRQSPAGLPARVCVNDALTWEGLLSADAGFTATQAAQRRHPMEMPDTFTPARGTRPATPTAPAAPEEPANLPLDDLPMHLEVQFRRRTMTLAEVAALSSGAILDLGINLSDPVVVKVNDQPMGTGQLVRIGDLVGVQIDRWTAQAGHDPTC